MRDVAPTTGHWPVICADGEPHNLDGGNSVVRRLAAADQIEVDWWFAARREQRLTDAGDGGDEDEDWPTSAPDGDWPDDVGPNNSLVTPFDVSSADPLPQVTIAMAPTTHPWEIPAFLGLGGWNDCPAAEEHCAVMRSWQDRYGGAIAAASHDVIEFAVDQPPTDRGAAMALAREHYEYCTDIVEQGCETIARLAATLLGGSAWFFWWD